MKQRLIGLSFVALSSLAIADDPPEVGEARAASGIPTSARFFGGATTDDGLSYTKRVDPATPVDIVGSDWLTMLASRAIDASERD